MADAIEAAHPATKQKPKLDRIAFATLLMMIESAEEFGRLRQSDDPDEQP